MAKLEAVIYAFKSSATIPYGHFMGVLNAERSWLDYNFQQAFNAVTG